MDYINQEQAKQFQASCKSLYYDRQLNLIDKPAQGQQRSCTDTCCLVLFLMMVGGFVGYAGYSVNVLFRKQFLELNPQDNVTFLKHVTQQKLQHLGVVVALCITGSIAIGTIVLSLLKCNPYITIRGLALITFMILMGIGLLSAILYGSWVCSLFFIAGMLYFFFIINFWDHLRKAAILMKTVGSFMSQNKKILFLLFVALIYCAAILFLWISGFYSFCVRYSHNDLSFEGFIVSFVFWVLMLAFFNFYFYYTSVFITANAIAIWFFDKSDRFDVIMSPLKLMVRYHLGTITFASLVITFGKLLKLFLLLARLKQGNNLIMCLVGTFVHIIIACCLGAIEAMIEVINNYAVIMCSLTGHKLIDSAKIVGEFIFNDPEKIFYDFTISTYVVNSGGVLTVSIIPTLVGALLLKDYTAPIWALSVVMIFFASSMIGLLILQIFVESASTLFLLYTLDGKLSEEGLEVVWIDRFAVELEKSFDQAFVGRLQKKKIKTKTMTTIIVHGNGAIQTFNQIVPDLDEYRSQTHIHPPKPLSSTQDKLII